MLQFSVFLHINVAKALMITAELLNLLSANVFTVRWKHFKRNCKIYCRHRKLWKTRPNYHSWITQSLVRKVIHSMMGTFVKYIIGIGSSEKLGFLITTELLDLSSANLFTACWEHFKWNCITGVGSSERLDPLITAELLNLLLTNVFTVRWEPLERNCKIHQRHRKLWKTRPHDHSRITQSLVSELIHSS